jgi:hypothetical protein
MATEDGIVMNNLMAAIYAAVGDEDRVNNIPGQEAYVSFSRPGIPLTPESLSFSFLTGSTAEADAAAGFSDLADTVPSRAPFWQPSGRRVSLEYSKCIDQPILPVDQLTEGEKAQLEEARATLETSISFVDPDTGQVKRSTTESPLYERYRTKRTAYDLALLGYKTAEQNFLRGKAAGDPSAEPIWITTEPFLAERLHAAFLDWTAAGKAQVETAIAERERFERRGAGRIFQDRRGRFNSMKRALGGGGAEYLFTKYFPDRFWEDGLNWTEFRHSHNEVHDVSEQTLQRMGGGASVGFGLWSFGGSVERNTDDRYAKSDTSDYLLQFRLAKIPLRRSWLDAGIFRSRNWALNYQLTSRADNISDGTGGGTMARMPVALIVARDVRLELAMSSETNTFAMEEISGSLRAGWGPFSVRGNYYKKTTRQTHDFVKDAKGISIPGMQIIGFVMEAIPKCPDPDETLKWPEGVKFDDIRPDVEDNGND